MPSAPPRIESRPDRGEPVVSEAQASAGGVVSIGNARPWSFAIEAGIGLRTTVVSPPFTGPGMVYEVAFRYAGAATNLGGFTLVWSNDDGGAQTNGPATTIPTGTRIFHPASIRLPGATDLDEIPEHIVEVAPGADPTQKIVLPVRHIVNTPDRWFLKASVRGPLAAGTFHVTGTIVVVEASSLEELRNFL
jgi:hypothetical protein